MRELKGVVPNETAISCSSEELAKQVHTILKECGYVWGSGDALVETLHYNCGVLYHIYDEVNYKFITYSGTNNRGKTVITAEEFIKINNNMKNLTKKDVYVSITSDEEAVKLRDLLQKAGEPIYRGSAILRGLGANECASFCDVYWQYGGRYGTKQVTLQQLAEILGVEQQFKIGDRVKIKESSKYYVGGDRTNPIQVLGTVYNIYDWIAVKWDNSSYNSYKAKDLDLAESAEEVKVETVTISRADLGRLYPIVCSYWQSYITSLLDDAYSFAVGVQVPLEKLRQAYKEADNKQKAILIEVAPLPKVKSTVKISRWVNLYGNAEGSLFKTEEEALRSECSGCTATIELTGEYTTEVEDPLMINEDDELAF